MKITSEKSSLIVSKIKHFKDMKKLILLLLSIIIGVAIGIFLERFVLSPTKTVERVIEKIVEPEEFFKVYKLHPEHVLTGKSEYDYLVVDFYILIPKDLPMMKRLKTIAKKLSEEKFKLPIEVLKIEEQDGEKIAIINLREHPVNQGRECIEMDFVYPRWCSGYFQGSLGGQETYIILVETFLQRDYKGSWIDGIKFMYEDKPIDIDIWDHIDLAGIKYRNPR